MAVLEASVEAPVSINDVNVANVKFWKEHRSFESKLRDVAGKVKVVERLIERYPSGCAEERKLMEGTKPHVRRILQGKPMFAIKKILEHIGHSDTNIIDELCKGAKTSGPVSKSNLKHWPSLEKPKKANSIFSDETKVPEHNLTPAKPWQEEELQSVLWQKVQEEISEGLSMEIPRSSVYKRPDRSFIVIQNTTDAKMRLLKKMRHIYDASFRNRTALVFEKLQLPFAPYVKELFKLVATPLGTEHHILKSFPQSRRTVFQQISRELRRSKHSSVPVRLNGRKRSRLRNPTLMTLKRFFKVGISTRDVSKAYKQLPVADPNDNCVCVFDPITKSWKFFACLVMGFGNVHSVYQWCRFAEAIAAIARFLRIPLVVYVDDFIIITTTESLKACDDRLGWLLDILKVAQSLKSYSTNEHNPIKVLGLLYNVIDETCTAPPLKCDKAVKDLTDLISEINVFGIQKLQHDKVKDLAESIAGQLVFVILCRDDCSSATPLARSVRDLAYKDNVLKLADKKFANTIKANCNLLIEKVRKLKPESISVNTCMSQKAIVCFTDAALENGVPTMGGFSIGLAEKRAFSTLVKEENRPRNHNIMLWEALAVLALIVILGNSIANTKVAFFIDNTCDIYQFIKCESKDRRVHAVLQQIWSKLERIKCYAVFFYINTKENPADLLTRDCVGLPFLNLKMVKIPQEIFQSIRFGPRTVLIYFYIHNYPQGSMEDLRLPYGRRFGRSPSLQVCEKKKRESDSHPSNAVLVERLHDKRKRESEIPQHAMHAHECVRTSVWL